MSTLETKHLAWFFHFLHLKIKEKEIRHSTKEDELKTGMLYGALAAFFLTGCLNDGSVKISHKPNFKNQTVEVRGTTTGYGNLRTDGVADFGLVLKSFNKQDLFQIELDDLMSTSIDRINVFGQNLDIPSNVALPDQRERYIFSIRLNKPNYRIFFEPNRDTSVIILHGQFPFSDVIDGFRNGTSLLQLAGLFNILSYTEYPGTTSNGSLFVEKNLNVGQNLLRETQSVSAPTSTPRDYNFVAVSLLPTSGGNGFYPTDIKVVPQNRTSNIKIERQQPAMLTGLFHSSFADPSSTQIQKHKMTLQLHSPIKSTSSLLGFVENLNYSNGTLSFTAPSLAGHSASEMGVTARVFDVSGPSPVLVYDAHQIGMWSNSIDLSGFDSIRQSRNRYRIELSLHASTSNQAITNLDELFNNTEFVTRNAIAL